MTRLLILAPALWSACAVRADCIDPDFDLDPDADDCVAGVYVSDNGPYGLDADWLGDDSSLTEELEWRNSQGSAELSVSIERPGGRSSVDTFAGSTLVEVLDGEGQSLELVELQADPERREVERDEIVLTGAPGAWTVRIELVDFSGTGSISLER